MSNRCRNLSFLVVLLTAPAWAGVDIRAQTKLVVQVKSVTLNTATITGGGTVNGVVTLNAAASGNGVTVKIVSSAPQIAEVPPSVVVQPNATSASFIIQTHPVAMNPNVVTPPPSAQITAQAGVSSQAVATLTVLPPTLTALTLNPATVAGGTNSTGTVTISGPTPSAGMTIALSSPSSTSSQRTLTVLERVAVAVGLPSSVNIPAGATSASFTMTTRPVAASTTHQIDAKWGAFTIKTATLTVTPPDISSFTPSYLGATAGSGFSGTVNLSGPAPAGGMTINMKTTLAYGGTTGTFAQCGPLPTVPATVTVPAGATSTGFTGTTSPGYGVFWVVGSTATKSAQVALSVNSVIFNVILPASVKGGTLVQGKIQLNGPAMSPNCGNRYTLKSSDTNYAQVPAYVDVTPGATEATFPITTTALPASSAPVTVTITGTGVIVGNNAPAPAKQYPRTANMTITP